MIKNNDQIISKKNQKTAIVIGAGFGGISLAIRLQSMGYLTFVNNP